ncbi:hypothetical protein cyc_01713 [Cyclospora cayetanensis]|uniref:Uncharacterized protein n=1 Tax=Cyclospora cayetanensis TaxID=88456 RepID=A0A1D3D7C1_9EIME|nr:hypothetical protein cyc_01713 [Cyclospora cayetanensis]
MCRRGRPDVQAPVNQHLHADGYSRCNVSVHILQKLHEELCGDTMEWCCGQKSPQRYAQATPWRDVRQPLKSAKCSNSCGISSVSDSRRGEIGPELDFWKYSA